MVQNVLRKPASVNALPDGRANNVIGRAVVTHSVYYAIKNAFVRMELPVIPLTEHVLVARAIQESFAKTVASKVILELTANRFVSVKRATTSDVTLSLENVSVNQNGKV